MWVGPEAWGRITRVEQELQSAASHDEVGGCQPFLKQAILQQPLEIVKRLYVAPKECPEVEGRHVSQNSENEGKETALGFD